MKTNRINDEERRLWVLNHEGLYNESRRYKGSLRNFIRENRTEIDKLINATLNKKPAEKSWRNYQ